MCEHDYHLNVTQALFYIFTYTPDIPVVLLIKSLIFKRENQPGMISLDLSLKPFSSLFN
jgi:hypothetical protein